MVSVTTRVGYAQQSTCLHSLKQANPTHESMTDKMFLALPEGKKLRKLYISQQSENLTHLDD
jgi:hypothetical protein